MTVAQMDSRYYEDAFPLSPVQRQLLLESQHAAAPARMLYQFTCIIEGNLDVQAFRRAWQKTADFNPGLRMAFLSGDRREPEQVRRGAAALVPPTQMEGIATTGRVRLNVRVVREIGKERACPRGGDRVESASPGRPSSQRPSAAQHRLDPHWIDGGAQHQDVFESRARRAGHCDQPGRGFHRLAVRG